MEREKIKRFLLSEIKKEQEKIKTLSKMKSEAEGARTSWSSHEVYDLENEIFQHTLHLTQCQAILQSLENSAPSKNIRAGSIVTLSIGGDEKKYLILEEGGGSIGDYFAISAESPVGKAILGKRAGEKVKTKVPGGTISIKILEVA